MLRFHIGNIPVTVHPPFLLMALLLGAQLGSDVPLVVSWLIIVFVSVLAHELGHALSGIAFGLEPRIDLHGMGGLTSWAHKNVSTAKKIAISVAGPAVGITIGGILYFTAPMFLTHQSSRLAVGIVALLIEVNLYWGALNLLPMLPLDGGNALAHALGHTMGAKGIRIAHIVSIVTAVLAGIGAFLYGWGLWSVFLALLFAGQNIRALMPRDDGPPPPTTAHQW